MISKRRFLNAVFGASQGTVTRGIGDVVGALTTRKTSNQVLGIVTWEMWSDAKMFMIPYIPLVTKVKAREHLYAEGWIA
jgi:hypothetical protein